MFLLSAVDVLEVLTEVDEKSRRSPEIIQYFIVSQKQNRRSSEAAAGMLTPVTVYRTICRDSWLHLRSCVGTWPSAWLCAASRTIPGNRWLSGNIMAFFDSFQGNHVYLLCCSLATDFLPTFMYCMSSGNFDVVQTALRNLPEYVLLCQGWGTVMLSTMSYNLFKTSLTKVKLVHPQLHVLTYFPPLTEHADILLHKAFIVGIYGQIDTSSVIAESMKVLHMEAI